MKEKEVKVDFAIALKDIPLLRFPASKHKGRTTAAVHIEGDSLIVEAVTDSATHYPVVSSKEEIKTNDDTQVFHTFLKWLFFIVSAVVIVFYVRKALWNVRRLIK